MKRIVNGVTYNTDTSTPLAQSKWEEDNGVVTQTLFQTQGGAFFVHANVEKRIWDPRFQEHDVREFDEFIPKNPEEAHQWIMTGDTTVWHNPFEDPPEATAEAEPGATIYLRVPASLKQRVEEAAGAAKVSGNVWAMRCVEQCLGEADSSPPAWLLRDPTVDVDGREPRIVLRVAEGWPVAGLTKAHAALLGRQLLKAVEETK